MFGQEDVLGDRNYTTSVKCITNTGSLYWIKNSEFLNKLQKDDRTWKLIERVNYQNDVRTKSTMQHAMSKLEKELTNETRLHTENDV